MQSIIKGVMQFCCSSWFTSSKAPVPH